MPLVTGLTAPRNAINRSNVSGPASVEEPTSKPSAPSLALTVTPGSRGSDNVTYPPGLTVRSVPESAVDGLSPPVAIRTR